MAAGEDHRRLAGDVHRLELFGLVGGGRVGEIVEGLQPPGDPLPAIAQAGVVDRAVEGGMAGGPLLHELGEQPGLVSRPPLCRHLAEDPVAHRPSLPVGDDDLLVRADVLLRHPVAGHLPVVQDAQVLGRVAGQLGEGRHRLGGRAAFADDQLVVADIQSLVFAQVLEAQGPQHRQRVFAAVFLVEAGLQNRPLDRDGWSGLETAAAQPFDPAVHVNLRYWPGIRHL